VIWRDGNISFAKSWKFRPVFGDFPLATLQGFIPMMGAMMLATIYIPLRRWAGASIGIAMPLMLSSYEFLVGSQQKKLSGNFREVDPSTVPRKVYWIPKRKGVCVQTSSSPTILWLGRAVKASGVDFFLLILRKN